MKHFSEQNFKRTNYLEEDFQDIYNETYASEMLENDEVNPSEAGFMQGYLKF